MKITWYISSPRAESCSSVLAAVNKALKAYTPEAKKHVRNRIRREGSLSAGSCQKKGTLSKYTSKETCYDQVYLH
jgi:hypothetical protein